MPGKSGTTVVGTAFIGAKIPKLLLIKNSVNLEK